MTSLPAARRPLTRLQDNVHSVALLIFVFGVASGFVGLLPMPIVFAATFIPLMALSIYQRRPVMIAIEVMVVVLVVSMVLLARVVAGDEKKIAGWPPSPSYPILIVARMSDGHHEPYVIYYHELEEAQKQLKDWSFLVPPGEAKAMMKKFDGAGLTKTMFGHDLWFPRFAVSDAGPNRQRLEVNGASDDDETNHSWYEAQDKEFTPLYYSSLRGGPHLEACGPVAGVFVAWLLTTIVVVYYVNSKQRGVNV